MASSIRSIRLYLARRSGSGNRADLDLARRGGDGQVGDRRVFGFAGPGRDDRTIAASPASTSASSVSESVPTWFTLIRIALAAFFLIPSASRADWVANRSSPMS